MGVPTEVAIGEAGILMDVMSTESSFCGWSVLAEAEGGIISSKLYRLLKSLEFVEYPKETGCHKKQHPVQQEISLLQCHEISKPSCQEDIPKKHKVSYERKICL